MPRTPRLARPMFALLLVGACLAPVHAQRPLDVPNYYLSMAPELLDGVPVDGVLESGDGQNFKDGTLVDVLVMRSAGNEIVDVAVTSDDFDTYLSVFAPDGTLLDANDDAFGDDAAFASRVRVALDAPGTYMVVVSGWSQYDDGPYQVVRSTYVPPEPVEVEATVPGIYEGVMEREGIHSYFLTLDEAANVSITMRSALFDTYLEVYDDEGYFVADNDDFEMDSTDSRVELQLEPGRYEIVVLAYFEDETGPYTLTIDTFVPAEPVVIDVTSPGTFEGTMTSDDFHTYVLTLPRTADVTITVRSDAFDTLLSIFDEDGYFIDENDDMSDGSTNSQITSTFGAGTYLIDVSSFYGDGAGPYTIDIDW